MYKLAFLLIFSAANVSGAKDVKLDIDIISQAETSCHVTPDVTQILTEDEHIRFHIQTPTKLKYFWCNNANGTLIYHPAIPEKPTNYHGKNNYTLAETSTDSISDMEGNWTCSYQTFEKGSINKTRQGTCLFQVKVTNKPGVSLNIADLSPLTWNNGIKLYHYSFTEGEKTFDCILANPTEEEEIYTISFKLDGSHHKRSPRVTLKARSKVNLTDVFKLNETSEHIVCSAINVKGDGPNLRAEINLQYIPHFTFYVNGSSELEHEISYQSNLTQIYSYKYTDDENITVTLDVNEGNKDTYDIEFYLDGNTKISSRDPKALVPGTSSKTVTLKLNKRNKNITCVVLNRITKKRVLTVVNVKHKKQDSASGVELNIQGLPDNSLVHKLTFSKTYNYTYDQDRIGITLPLRCVLEGSQVDSDWSVQFGTNRRQATLKKDGSSPIIVSYNIPLNSENNTVTCNATKTTNAEKVLTSNVNIHYIPKPTTSTSTTTTTTEPATAQTIQSIEPPQGNSSLSVPQSSGEEGSSSLGWLKWVLGGGALLITICVVVGCLVMYCQKKPPPADSTYANLTKDERKPTPIPAPRTIQKTNDGQKPSARKPNVALDNNYSEPKDSQDMSEALYADPNRFVGDSSNYAEPYVAKPNPCDTYSEPYKSNYAEPYPCTSEGNYAELNLPDCRGKELYAKPIPKAQRTPKLKDDCNYSNVFGGQYGNTNK